MQNYQTRYLAQTSDGKEWVQINLDLTPFLDDGLSESVAIESACEVFQRNCINFIEW